MTLVISYIAPDYIVQISDRRVGLISPDGTYKMLEDNRNKAIPFQRTFAFSYAGVAKIDDIYTDQWIALTIENAPTGLEACKMIAIKASESFRKIYAKNPLHKFHEFVAVGWVKHGNDIVPAFVRITNGSRDGNGNVLPKINENFKIIVYVLGEKEIFHLEPAGDYSSIRQSDKINPKEIYRLMRKCFIRKLGPQPISRLIIVAMHEAAEQYRKLNKNTIGKNLLVLSIPKLAVVRQNDPRDMFLIFGKIWSDAIGSAWISPASHFILCRV